MMKRLIMVLLAATVPVQGFADIKSDIAECATTKSDASRLICFDQLAKSLGVDKPVTNVEESSGEWHVQTKISPVDDSKNVTLVLEANEKIPGKLGVREVMPYLFIRCSENKTDAYIAWKRYLGISSTKVLTRIDKRKAVNSTWTLSTDNEATFARKAISFAKSLFDRDKLLVQVTPYGSSPVMTTFNVSGLRDSIKPLRKACHW